MFLFIVQNQNYDEETFVFGVYTSQEDAELAIAEYHNSEEPYSKDKFDIYKVLANSKMDWKSLW